MSETAVEIRCPYCNGPISSEDIKNGVIKCSWCRKESFLKNSSPELTESVKLRNDLEFEQAKEVASRLLETQSDNPEVYWQLLLCDFGISFGQENGTIVENPLLNTPQPNPIYENPWYKKLVEACEKTGEKNIYEPVAKQIEEIRIRANRIIKNEKKYDCFICYKQTPDSNEGKTIDSEYARELYQKLTAMNLKVFFAEETLGKEYAGDPYEPHIYHALMTAKVMFLVAGNSKDGSEYPFRKYVKSEWKRFLHRMDSGDNSLNLVPCLIDPTFDPGRLPNDITKRGFQAIYFARSNFDDGVKNAINRYITRGGVSIIDTNHGVEGIASISSTITFGAAKHYTDQNLSQDENIALGLAKSDMVSKTPKAYKSACEKINKILAINSRNFDANFTKVLCLFNVQDEKELRAKSIADCPVNKLPELNDCINNSLATAGDNFDSILKTYSGLIAKAIDDGSFSYILQFLGKPFDVFRTIVNYYNDDRDGLFAYVSGLNKSFTVCVNKKPAAYDVNTLNEIIEHLFKDAFGLFGKNGTKQVIALYDRLADSYLSNGYYDKAKAFYDKDLQLFASNTDAIWGLFLCNIKVSSWRNLGKSKFGSKNFVAFDPNNDKCKENNYTNLYAVLVKLYKSKYRIKDQSENYFMLAKNLAYIMLAKGKAKLATTMIQEIRKLVLAKTSDEEFNEDRQILARRIYLEFANNLALLKEFSKAKKIFTELTVLNQLDAEAHWGLLRCECKCRSNYTLFCRKKNITDSINYQNAYTAAAKADPTFLEKIIAFNETYQHIKSKRSYANSYGGKVYVYERYDIINLDCTDLADCNDAFNHTRAQSEVEVIGISRKKANPVNKRTRLSLNWPAVVYSIVVSLIAFAGILFKDYISIPFCILAYLIGFYVFRGTKKINLFGQPYRLVGSFIGIAIVVAFSALCLYLLDDIMPNVHYALDYAYQFGAAYGENYNFISFNLFYIFIKYFLIFSVAISIGGSIFFYIKSKHRITSIMIPVLAIGSQYAFMAVMNAGASFLFKQVGILEINKFVFAWIALCYGVQVVLFLGAFFIRRRRYD